MLRLGLPVPDGFVVTDAAFRELLGGNGLGEQIGSLCRPLEARDPEGLRRASRLIRDLVTGSEVPEQVRREASKLRRRLLPGATLAVRSSGVGEDSECASFAGQLDSLLDVGPAEELGPALIVCWASYWSERSLFYQLSRGIELGGMGVVVQEQVRSRISGVLFTEAPSASYGGRGALLGEYCFGLGGDLVSGRISPGRFSISRAGFGWRRHEAPDQPAPEEDACLFNDALMSALARAGLELEKEFGSPQDIEWTIDRDGRLFFLQSRPITVSAAAVSDSGSVERDEAARPEQPRVHWSNANVSENFPGPISPLLYSIASLGYYHYFRNLARAFGIAPRRIRAMEHPLRNLIGVHGARIYYNLTNIHTVLAMAPFGGRLSESFNQFVGAAGTPARPQRAAGSNGPRRGRAAQLLELCVVAARTTWQYLVLSRRVEAFEATADEFARRTEPAELSERSLPVLLEDLRSFLDIRCNRWTNASLADCASMVCYGLLKALLARAFPSSDQGALHNTLLKGLTDIVSSKPAARLWDLSRHIREDAALSALFSSKENGKILALLREEEEFAPFMREFERFLRNWGFRCSGELMLTVPSFEEDPLGLVEILKSYAGLGGESPVEVLRRQERQRNIETARVMEELGRRKALPWVPRRLQPLFVKMVLRATHRSISLRERARLKQALLYSRCRRIVLAMGDRLTALGHLRRREDVFLLTVQELDQLVRGGAMFPRQVKALVEMRQAAHDSLSAMSPPDAFSLPEGAYLAGPGGAPAPEGPESEAIRAGEMSGIGACGGRVTARAAVLEDLSESHLVSAGDVLVTRQTDPGWGPVFFLIGGLILERGGMLSHGSILAREYGIPSVVGLKEATRRIQQGRKVCVDGDRGVVRFAD
jgi:pyruvate,water dikinase